MAKVNIRESLGRLDLLTDNKYDLRNTYDSSNISNDKKKKLAESLNNNASAKQIYNILNEDTIKQNGKWVNKGKEGTHGKFKTKKAADAQRKAMFANGHKAEALEEAYSTIYYPVTRMRYGKNIVGPEFLSVQDAIEYAKDGLYDEIAKETSHSVIDTSPDTEYYTVEEAERLFSKGSSKNEGVKEDWEPDEWEETDFLDDEGKKVYINIIKEAEDIDDLKDIAHDLYWHDKGLFAMLRNFPKDKSFEWIQNRMIEVIESTMNESLTEASYGGAYDIEDDMFWTKDDLIEFSDAVCEKLADKFGYQYDIADVGAENNNDMYITIMDTTHDIEADVSFRIKMSRIRAPRDLMKYLDTVVSEFVKKFEEEYQYYEFDESLKESIDISDYEELHYPLRDGDKYYQLYRKIENGKGVWAAAELDKYGSDVIGEPFKITYEQARGFEPIEDSSIRELSRDLGKKLLPKRENLNEAYRPLAIGYMILKKEIPNHINYAEFANYDEVVTAIPSEAVVVVYPRGGKISGTDIAYWQFDAIDLEGKKTKANFSTYIYSLKDFLNNDEMELKLIPDFKLIDEYPYLIEVDDDIEESLIEGIEDLDSISSTKAKDMGDADFKVLKPLVDEYLKDRKALGNWPDSVDERNFVKKWYKLADKCKEITKNGLQGITGYGRLNDFIKIKILELARSVDNTFLWYARNQLEKFGELSESLKEDIDDEIDLDYESDFDDNEVEEGNHVFADGEEYVWVERIAGPIYLDFDKWAVWSARVFVDPRDFMTIHSDGKNYDFDGDAFKEKAMAAPIVYFVVEEDTGFIDWGPEDNEIAAKDFLNGKQEDWDNDEYYGESLEKNLDEWYVHTIHYEDIGDGREYDYEVDHEEVLDYLSEIAIDEEDAPEDTEEYLKWVEDNFDELFNKYEYEIEEHFREDASQEEYDRRHSSYES